MYVGVSRISNIDQPFCRMKYFFFSERERVREYIYDEHAEHNGKIIPVPRYMQITQARAECIFIICAKDGAASRATLIYSESLVASYYL